MNREYIYIYIGIVWLRVERGSKSTTRLGRGCFWSLHKRTGNFGQPLWVRNASKTVDMDSFMCSPKLVWATYSFILSLRFFCLEEESALLMVRMAVHFPLTQLLNLCASLSASFVWENGYPPSDTLGND